MKRFAKVIVLFFFLLGVVAPNLTAEEPEKYPTRPVTLIHAFAAGGSTDLAARAVASIAPKYFSQPIIVVPKPGGAGLVALQTLASAKPDGYTFHLGRTGDMTIGPLVEKIPFDMEEDFIPVGQVAVDRAVISVSAKSPWKTVEELIADAKKEPGKIKFASSGPATGSRFACEKFCREAGIKLTCVPFKGSAPAAIAVAGGHIPVLTSAVSEALPHVQRGDMRAILLCSEKRIKEYPDTPTAKEKGLDVTSGIWHAVFAPKGTPPAILAKFEDLLKKIAEDKEFVSAMTKMGSEPGFLSAKDFAQFWKGERKWMGEMVKEVGLAKNK